MEVVDDVVSNRRAERGDAHNDSLWEPGVDVTEER